MEQSRSGQSFAFELKGNSAVIWRCFSYASKVELPEFIEGYPVTEVAPYAFSAHMNEADLYQRIQSGQVKLQLSALEKEDARAEELTPVCGMDLEEILLPSKVRKIGRYCFYDCDNLRGIEFPGDLSDWGSGVFTGCHHVERLCIHIRPDGNSYLKAVLEELVEQMEISFVMESNTGETQFSRVIFPDFYEEGTENTPARLLGSRIHGSGVMYRNCFQGRKFDFRQYDLVFQNAKALEPDKLMWRLSLERLRYPLDLTERAKTQYMDFIWEKRKEVAAWLLEQNDVPQISWFLHFLRENKTEEGLEIQQGSDELLGYMIDQAAKLGRPEIMSTLMNERRRQTGNKSQTKRKRLEL